MEHFYIDNPGGRPVGRRARNRSRLRRAKGIQQHAKHGQVHARPATNFGGELHAGSVPSRLGGCKIMRGRGRAARSWHAVVVTAPAAASGAPPQTVRAYLAIHRVQRSRQTRQAAARCSTRATSIYTSVRGKSAFVFSNSREETEYVCATLREIRRAARRAGQIPSSTTGFLSAFNYEECRGKALSPRRRAWSPALPVTLELGIDIGKLERIVQLDAPFTVSNFLQHWALGQARRTSRDDDGFQRRGVAAEHCATPAYPVGVAPRHSNRAA